MVPAARAQDAGRRADDSGCMDRAVRVGLVPYGSLALASARDLDR